MLWGLLTTGCPEDIGGCSAKKGMVYVKTTKPPSPQERKSDLGTHPAIKCQIQSTTERLNENSLAHCLLFLSPCLMLDMLELQLAS